MKIETIKIQVKNVKPKTRIDKYLEEALIKEGYSFSRNQIQKYIEFITLNNKPVKKNSTIKNGDIITFSPPPPQEISLEPEDVPFEIVYDDEHIVVINKPFGIVVHPAKGNYSGTLVNGLLKRISDFQPIGGTIRPGIVHRLDKDTSGLMVVAKNEIAYQNLIESFKNREIIKIYHCISVGVPNFETKTIEANIGRHPRYRKKFTVMESGKYAKTQIKVLETFKENALLKIKIFTGRTHQIRVHLSYINLPIAGDPIYSKSANKYPQGLALVSKKLKFKHPVLQKEISFECNYPKHFEEILSMLKK